MRQLTRPYTSIIPYGITIKNPNDNDVVIKFPGMVQESAGQMPTTGETEPAAAPQRHGNGQQDGVVQEQLDRQLRQQRFENVREIVRRRRRQRGRQQQQQDVADDQRRPGRRRRRRHQLDGRQLARVHRHVAVVQPAVAARWRHVVHQADIKRHAAHTTTARRVPSEFR